MVYWRDGDDWECDGRRVWWELQDSWCFHVEISPWPPRAGPVRLTFRYGPDDVHMRYAIRTESPMPDDPEDSNLSPWGVQWVRIDHAPWEWQRFSPEGFQSDAPPFWANIELPPGRVRLAFSVQQQDHLGRWFGNAVLDDWMLEVGGRHAQEQGSA
jgi:hypothetical protein